VRAREAGADEVVTYKTEDVAARVKAITGAEPSVDRVIEVAFGVNVRTDVALLRPNGTIATYASDAVHEPQIPFWPMLAKDLAVRFVLVYAMPRQAHDEAAAFITDALSRGVLKHQIHRVFSLDQIVAAHEATETMTNVGKVLVRIDQGPE
jgi:NADPH2:quinone reductase